MTIQEKVTLHQGSVDYSSLELRKAWKDRNRSPDVRDWIKLLIWDIRASQKNIYNFHMEALKLSAERADKYNKLATTT